MTERPALADAGPLIHLDEIDLANALDLFPAVLVPPDVAAEKKKRPNGPGNVALQRCETRAPTGRKPSPMGALSVADVAAIQLAREIEGILLTDDLDLRDTAHLAGLHVVGTIGIIVRAGRIGAVPRETARPALDLLRAESTPFITPKLVHQTQQALEPCTAEIVAGRRSQAAGRRSRPVGANALFGGRRRESWPPAPADP